MNNVTKSETPIGKISLLIDQVKEYCTEKQVELFCQGAIQKPVGGLIRNTKYKIPFEESAIQDEKDPLLFRFDKEDRFGKYVEHFMGAYYMLDPSSASISYFLKDLLPPHFICMDLCSAPGGKSISLAMRRDDGIFLCNDISFSRANEIGKNAQRLGLDNLLTMSLDSQKIELPGLFDLVLLDTPCSGSGMFRKEPKMLEDYSIEKMMRLLPLQESLLEKAYDLTASGGYLCYSTCSLSVQEDEAQIDKFLKKHPDMCEIKVDKFDTMVEGEYGYHFLPGIFSGEGIYFCLLRKKGTKKRSFTPLIEKKETRVDGRRVFQIKKGTYLVREMFQEWKDLPFLAPGLKYLDDSPYQKCKYDHAASKLLSSVPKLPVTREQAISYASGNEVILKEKQDGLIILTYQGIPLGFGKAVQNRVKNYLPKGLREMVI